MGQSPRRQAARSSDDLFKCTAFLLLSAVCLVLLVANAHLWHKQSRQQHAVPAGASKAEQQGSSKHGQTRLGAIGTPEVWAQGPPDELTTKQQQLALLLSPETLAQLKELCGRCLYRTLTSYVRVHNFGDMAVVLTGDIPAMWIRDSAVQMATYLPRIARRPALRATVEGAIRAQAYFILQDPWANAYNPHYVAPHSLPKAERQLGRGGWVWNRNFELDSVAYFFNYLWNYHQTAGIWRPEVLLQEPHVHDAVVLLLKVLMIEQHHEQLSPYRYAELPRNGVGQPSGYTGMVWSAFRPSDDPQVFGYNVPDNMYLWGALQRLRQLNDAVWHDPEIESASAQLMQDVHAGVLAHGIVEVMPGVRAYAYEVDGLGGALVDFDDPNVPSLLATPLLGYTVYDEQVYNTTRARLLSRDTNAFYFTGEELHGLGSPHTDVDHVWPLATAVDALTSGGDLPRQAELLGMLLKMAAVNGLVHESVHINETARFSRPEFGWANAMTVVALEALLGVDCDREAEKHRLAAIAEREASDAADPPNGGPDAPQYYEQLEAGIIHVVPKLEEGQGGDGVGGEDSGWEDAMSAALQQELLAKVLGVPPGEGAGSGGPQAQPAAAAPAVAAAAAAAQ